MDVQNIKMIHCKLHTRTIVYEDSHRKKSSKTLRAFPELVIKQIEC